MTDLNTVATGAYDDAATLQLGESVFVADISGALFWPEQDILIAADLHLEKGSSFARRGSLLPPYDTEATLKRLAGVVDRYRPATLALLGDSFHDNGGAARLQDKHCAAIGGIAARTDILWIAGNHDPNAPADLPGRTAAEAYVAGFTLRHEPMLDPPHFEIAGHLHPGARVRTKRGTVRSRCFASDGKRIILPAFGAYAGALALRNPAFDGLFENARLAAYVIGTRRVYRVSGTWLV